MNRIAIVFFLFLACLPGISQNNTTLQRPKLVVGIVVDQMRWDYLYRYYDRYSETGGFKRLINQGYSCDNTLIPYTPTITACGHACIFTGAVPAINGITGNDWWDDNKKNYVYCTEDNQAKTVGSNSTNGQMSPENLLVTTIGDELRLATNFRSKVIGIALKDRGAILPAGHSANGAYWYDNTTGDWVSSSYYIKELPSWAKNLNAKKLPDQYYAQDWNTLYPVSTYVQSAPTTKKFPLQLKNFVGKNYEVISATPYGNSLTVDMAKAAIEGDQLGADAFTDLLTVSFSTPDYIGHAYGPNSIEQEDCFLKLDKDLGNFLDFLDEKIGKGEYVIFLTADHGAANMPSFLKEHNIPAGNFDNDAVTQGLNNYLNETFKSNTLVKAIMNYQVYFDRNEVALKNINRDSLYSKVIAFLLKDPSIERVFSLSALNETTLNKTLKESFANGYYPGRSGDLQIIFRPQYIDGFLKRGTTHGVWNPYDAHIPLLWYGWGIPHGKTNQTVYMTDIAPTLSAMLMMQSPSGSIGHVIEGAIKK